MDEIAEQIDRLDDLLAELHTPLPLRLHVRSLKESLPAVIEGLKAGYLAAGGENDWDLRA